MGILKNARQYANKASLDDFVPEWLLRYTIYAPPNAILGETPEKQVEGSIIMMIWSVKTGLFTGGVTAIFVFFWGIFLMIGVLRWSDWFGSRYDTARSTLIPGMGGNGSYKIRRGDK
ncbi:hypothetical protein [Natronorubrum texcoconense]|uniref:Uncharacterized protein n=1 Tax=Natronorubrum texcoconense TaxID=1095776 RepID=A0A1G9H7U4_9EURY|nr:hypothetical protein [Natronorubrum texcoconense]SDL08939.1 hypothetical protein SAMN04515672_0136 [Natronorubrum texcoconense]